MTIPPDHIRAMADLIDAQARHIEKLEAGHWSQHTRAEVDAAHYRYIGKGAPPPSAFDKGGELTPIDHGDAVPVEIHHGGPEIPRTLAEIDADVEEASKQHPTHTNNHIIDVAWPPKGECARCDALQPLWDERQARLFQAARQLRAAHGDHRATPNTQCGYHAPDGWDCRLSTGHPWPHRAAGPWGNEATE